MRIFQWLVIAGGIVCLALSVGAGLAHCWGAMAKCLLSTAMMGLMGFGMIPDIIRMRATLKSNRKDAKHHD